MTGVRSSTSPGAGAWWVAVGLYAGVIFWLSSQAHPLGADSWPSGADKVAHAALYAGLSILLFKALRRSYPHWSPGRLALVSVGLASLYGASDEWHQSFVPSREMDPVDLLADSAGAGLAQGVIRWRAGRDAQVRDASRSL